MEKQGRRELNKVQCRRRILRASRKLFSSKGYEETTIEDIADHANISKATLYNYFSGKDSLLLGIAEQELADVRNLVENELQDEPRVIDKLRHVIHVVIIDAMLYLQLSRKIAYLDACEESDIYATLDGLLEIVQELVAQAQQNGEFRADANRDEIVEMYVSVYYLALFHWVHPEEYSEEYFKQKIDRFLELSLISLRT